MTTSFASFAYFAGGDGEQRPIEPPPLIPATASAAQPRSSSNTEEDLAPQRPLPSPLGPDALAGIPGEVVRTLSPYTEADDAATLFQFLTAFGNVIGRNVYFVAEADRHYSNLYVVLVGASSKGRKGTSFGRVRQIVDPIDEMWAKDCQVQGLSSGEGLIWAVRDPIEKQEAVRDKGRVIGYQMVETDPGVADKRLLVVESEYALVLKTLARDGNTLSAIIRNAWDRGDLKSLTKNSPARATGAHISIVGHITKQELLRYLDDTEAGNGFGNRFVWVYVQRSKLLPDGAPVPEGKLQYLTSLIRGARDFGCEPRELRRDAEAAEYWRNIYAELSSGKVGLLGAMTARAEAQVMRFASIYAILDRSAVIRLDHLLSGLACWKYCDESAAYIFGDSLGDPIADEILRALRAEPGGMTRTEIVNHFGRHKSGQQIARSLRSLVEVGSIKREIEATEGRPRERWFAQSEAARKAKEANKAPDGEAAPTLCSLNSLNSPTAPTDAMVRADTVDADTSPVPRNLPTSSEDEWEEGPA